MKRILIIVALFATISVKAQTKDSITLETGVQSVNNFSGVSLKAGYKTYSVQVVSDFTRVSGRAIKHFKEVYAFAGVTREKAKDVSPVPYALGTYVIYPVNYYIGAGVDMAIDKHWRISYEVSLNTDKATPVTIGAGIHYSILRKPSRAIYKFDNDLNLIKY
jgi:hypothetical protein